MSNTSNKFGTSGAWRGWRELSGDVNWEDYGGQWGRQDLNNPDHFYVIKHDNLVDAMGEREVEESGLDTHISTVYLVDLAATSAEQVQSAMDCCGLDFDDWMTPPSDDDRKWAIVDCLVSYGAAAPMGEHSHPYRADVARAAARREVEEYLADSDKRESALDRPVNRIGSTAREYAAGDMDSAMDRHRAHYRPSDWLPYMFGYVQAMGGAPADTSDDLAPEYVQGYKYGARVAKGEAPPCAWIKQG